MLVCIWNGEREGKHMGRVLGLSYTECIGICQYCSWPSSNPGAKWMSDQKWFKAFGRSYFLSFHYFQPEVLLAVYLISAYLVCYENRQSNRWWKTKCSQNTAMEIVIWIGIKSNPFCTTVFPQHHHLTSITAGCGQVWSVVLGVYITHLLRLPEKHIVTSIWRGKPDHLNDCRRRLNLERAAKHCFQSGA